MGESRDAPFNTSSERVTYLAITGPTCNEILALVPCDIALRQVPTMDQKARDLIRNTFQDKTGVPLPDNIFVGKPIDDAVRPFIRKYDTPEVNAEGESLESPSREPLIIVTLTTQASLDAIKDMLTKPKEGSALTTANEYLKVQKAEFLEHRQAQREKIPGLFTAGTSVPQETKAPAAPSAAAPKDPHAGAAGPRRRS